MDEDGKTPTVAEAAARIGARNEALRAFVRTRLDDALAEAQALEREQPRRSPLHGMPYSLKETWDTAGIPTSGGSWRYRERVPEHSTNVHDAFRAAGAVLMGKTNCSDLALVPESASWVGGVTRNPHDPARTPGGSSGGAAAAVADGMAAFDWGSDIGGSIRIPAAYCGVYGLRLSSETWPMVGDFPAPPPSLAFMNGQGPLCGSLGLMREVLRAAAPTVRTGAARPFRLRGAYLWEPEGAARGAWPSFAADAGPAVRAAFGAVRDDHGLPSMRHARNLTTALWASHFEDLLACDTLSLGEGVRAALSAVLLRGATGDRRLHPQTAQVLVLIALGRMTLFRDRGRAVRDAAAYRAQVDALWDRGWVLVAPTTTFPAPRHGRSILNWNLVTCTMPGNLADATALALPFGRYPDGLPRSLQIMGPPGSEDALLDAGDKLVTAARAAPPEG